MRTIPGNVRTDEAYLGGSDSITFRNIGPNASKRGTRSCAAMSSTCGNPRVMFVDTSPPAGTRAVVAQVARGRRHGREAGLGTWVCEQRVCESEAATNGVREIVVARSSRAGTRLEDMNIYSHEYVVYAYDTGKCAHGRGLSWWI